MVLEDHHEDDGNDSSPSLHVHDLPQLYQKPTAASLLETLNLLSQGPSIFSRGQRQEQLDNKISEEGVPRYLTTIISSPLSWIASQEDRDMIYAAAAIRLSERAGRSALPNLTRVFAINDGLRISLHEPSMTEDNLGLKTWTSSLLLAQRLQSLGASLPFKDNSKSRTRVLELGAGTGLVGIAAACLWHAEVMLTDLPEIVGNLEQNVMDNTELIGAWGGTAKTRALDWSDQYQVPKNEAERFPVVVAADPLYSPDHPKMLSETVERWLTRSSDSRFIIELPLRSGYDREREELKKRLVEQGLQLDSEGTDTGFDDWQGSDGEFTEVKCSWSVWKLASFSQ